MTTAPFEKPASLLPSFPVYPLLEAVDDAVREELAYAIAIGDFWDVDRLDAKLLPYLAHYLQADMWGDALGEEYQRDAIRWAWHFHHYRGSEASLLKMQEICGYPYGYTLIANQAGAYTGIDFIILAPPGGITEPVTKMVKDRYLRLLPARLLVNTFKVVYLFGGVYPRVTTALLNRNLAEITPTRIVVAAPAQPTGLTATGGSGSVALAWTNPNDANIAWYEVRRKLGADANYGAWAKIAGSGAATVSHTVTGLNGLTAYDFQIRAVSIGGNGPASDTASATTNATQQAAAPTGVTATAGSRSIVLAWTNPNDASITGYKYQIRRYPADGSTPTQWAWVAIPGSNAETTSYTIPNLITGDTYRLRLRAVNASGDGIPSHGPGAPISDPWYLTATPT